MICINLEVSRTIAPMKQITLKRNEKINKNFAYNIYIADQKVTELKNNESKTLDLNFDSEDLFVKIQWCGSKHISLKDIKDGQIIEISGNNFLNRRLPLFGSMIPLIGLTFTQNQLLENIGIGLLIILLSFTIATITIWRSKWIELRIRS